MSRKDNGQYSFNRHRLSYVVLIFSAIAITALAAITIINDPDEAKDVFNVILPVFSSWVGTILAFYFGRENFESANQQVRELVEKLSPEERGNSRVTSIMRLFRDMTVFQLPSDRSETDIRISELRRMFDSGCSRLPIVDNENRPLYMIHESMVDHYIASGNTEENTLEQFINQQREGGFSFKVNAGFVIASEKATIISAKQKMENLPSCQDIFITKEGSSDEPLSGWISNVRLAKFMNM